MIVLKYATGILPKEVRMSSETCVVCGRTVDYDDAYTHVEQGNASVAVCSRECLRALPEAANTTAAGR